MSDYRNSESEPNDEKGSLSELTVVLGGFTGGGTERVASKMIRHWVSCGIPVKVITRRGEERDFYSIPDSVPRIILGDAEVSPNKIIGLFRNIARIWRLRKAIKKMGSSTVLSMLWSNNILTILACAGLGKHVVISERNDIVRDTYRWPWNLIYRWIYRFADVVTANSKQSLKDLKSFLPESRLVFLPNPVTIPTEQANPEKSTVILNVGRLVPAKNQSLLLEAFAQISAEYPEWTVGILGEGTEKNNLIRLRDKLHLEERLNLYGLVKDIGEFYKTAAIFVLPSIYEGTPNALLEAMSFGLPCIVSDSCHGALEYVEDEINGFIFESGNRDDLSKKINRLIENPELRKQFGDMARERMYDLDIEKISGQWETVF